MGKSLYFDEQDSFAMDIFQFSFDLARELSMSCYHLKKKKKRKIPQTQKSNNYPCKIDRWG